MNSVPILNEAKKEYTNKLQQILAPRLYEGFKSIFEDILRVLSDEMIENNYQSSSAVKVFQKSLKGMPTQCKNIFIYSNQRDIMLKMSTIIHKKERLGLSIINHLEEFNSYDNISIINVTYSKGSNKDRFTKHSYWMKDYNVLKNINSNINNKNENRMYHTLN